MAELESALLGIRPRESSGSTTANRYGFQHTWALCHLIEMHASGEDYLLLLEFHEDVMVLDNETRPTVADFYQVKSKKKGMMTKAGLLEPQEKKVKDKNETLSNTVLGKLINNSTLFKECVRSMNLISSVKYKIPMSGNEKSEDFRTFQLTSLETSILEEIKEKIKKELGLNQEPPWEKVHLAVFDVGLTTHETHAVGELANFLEKRSPGGKFAVRPLYLTLRSEIVRRATHEWKANSLDELRRAKGISRSEFEGYIKMACEQGPDLMIFSDAEELLAREHVAYRKISALKEGWNKYKCSFADKADVLWEKFRSDVISVTDAVFESDDWETVESFLGLAEERYRSVYGAPKSPFDLKALRGGFLYEFWARETGKSSKVDPKP